MSHLILFFFKKKVQRQSKADFLRREENENLRVKTHK